MNFRIEEHVDAPVADVEGALLDAKFVAATATLPKVSGAELLDHRRDGNTARRRVRYRFTGDLPSAVTRVIDPDRLTWVEDSTFDLATHRSTHRILPDHYPDRLQASYDAALTEAGADRTVRTVTGAVKVRVALVARRVERAIVSGLQEHAEAESELLSRWLHGRR